MSSVRRHRCVYQANIVYWSNGHDICFSLGYGPEQAIEKRCSDSKAAIQVASILEKILQVKKSITGKANLTLDQARISPRTLVAQALVVSKKPASTWEREAPREMGILIKYWEERVRE